MDYSQLLECIIHSTTELNGIIKCLIDGQGPLFQITVQVASLYIFQKNEGISPQNLHEMCLNNIGMLLQLDPKLSLPHKHIIGAPVPEKLTLYRLQRI